MKRVLSFLVLLAAFGCQHKEKEVLVFDRLVGTWQMTDGSQYERWIKNSDTSYSSSMFSVANGDTVVAENVDIYKQGNAWHFKVQVKGQNQGKPVIFSSTNVKDSLVQFENPAHDFPKIVNYQVLPQQKMRAFISAGDTIYFNFNKVLPAEQ